MECSFVIVIDINIPILFSIFFYKMDENDVFKQKHICPR